MGAADMLAIVLTLALLSGLDAAPKKQKVVESIAPCKDCDDGLTALDEPIADRVMGAEEGAVEEGQADAGADIDLLEDEDEAIGDRIMKDKFDTALKRIGDEIDKDQAEQDEKSVGA